jgi:3-oxoacyl-[acyl-carrier protein] reductase
MSAVTEGVQNAGPLAGRRALVTGASRGIGAEIVRRLAADGAAVAFTYGASAVEAEKQPPRSQPT